MHVCVLGVGGGAWGWGGGEGESRKTKYSFHRNIAYVCSKQYISKVLMSFKFKVCYLNVVIMFLVALTCGL